MTKHIQRQTEVLKQKILYVGTLVEEAIAKAIAALINRDAPLAKKVSDADTLLSNGRQLRFLKRPERVQLIV